jgi:ribosomal protein S6--L-glutamate ligase
MKIAVLSRNRNLYSTRRLVQAARSRGHHVTVIDTMSVAVEVGMDTSRSNDIKIILPRSAHGASAAGIQVNAVSYLPQVDAIIPRIGASVTYYGLAVVRQFETSGVITAATSEAIARSRDKLQSLQAMNQAGLPIPKTSVIARPEALYSAINAVGGAPVVIKLIQGTQGRGVLLVPNLATAAAVFEKLRRVKRLALVQEFVAESEGRDTRIIVVGNRCVAAMTRIASQGEFRANLHLGGSAEPIVPDQATKELAIAAVRAHGLSVGGVDIIQSKRGPLLLEVNSSPGLEGIERVTGVDIASEIILYLEDCLSDRHRPRSAKRKRRR